MSTKIPEKGTNKHLLSLTADIVSSYVGANKIDGNDIPNLIQSVYSSLDKTKNASLSLQAEKKPAVSASKSITDDYLICLEDGKQLKMLKRYLRSRYGLTPDEYRRKWGLPMDYPMVAPAYARRRSQFAKDIGLGRGVGRKKKT